ncbi:MAG: leucine--tRNA ligase, partial [Flavobacteriales bacterium]
MTGLTYKTATPVIIAELEKREAGKGKINYRMRDAVFSRQRYWGEPFPIYYEGEIPRLISDAALPVALPEVDKYLPTESGEPPLARAASWRVNGHKPDFNTMPGWAGSSWYFLRYMDPNNPTIFADRTKIDYWNQVDLYMGGAEHATGHLLYARFWTKILFDLGFIGFDE